MTLNNQSNDSELRNYLTKEITCGRAISYDTLQFYGTLSADDKNRCTAIDNIITRIQDEILKARIEGARQVWADLPKDMQKTLIGAALEAQLTKSPKEGEEDV